uniref:TF-B3 domain-containing protein n=1 Tax=Kalanchoe fedtschenkoi TaxID=63787 RepID=A0A7N0UNL6_KALFE
MPPRTIPPKFVKLIWGELSFVATQVSPSGDSWSAKVCHSKGHVYLKCGWQEFRKDNLLKGNEMLVFTYNGKMRFHVQIFYASGVERMQVVVSKPDDKKDSTVQKKKYDEKNDSKTPKRQRGGPRKHPISPPNSGMCLDSL